MNVPKKEKKGKNKKRVRWVDVKAFVGKGKKRAEIVRHRFKRGKARPLDNESGGGGKKRGGGGKATQGKKGGGKGFF